MINNFHVLYPKINDNYISHDVNLIFFHQKSFIACNMNNLKMKINYDFQANRIYLPYCSILNNLSGWFYKNCNGILVLSYIELLSMEGLDINDFYGLELNKNQFHQFEKDIFKLINSKIIYFHNIYYIKENDVVVIHFKREAMGKYNLKKIKKDLKLFKEKFNIFKSLKRKNRIL